MTVVLVQGLTFSIMIIHFHVPEERNEWKAAVSAKEEKTLFSKRIVVCVKVEIKTLYLACPLKLLDTVECYIKLGYRYEVILS